MKPTDADPLTPARGPGGDTARRRAVAAFAREQHGLDVDDGPFAHHQRVADFRGEPAMLVVPRPQATRVFPVYLGDLAVFEADPALAWILFAEWFPNWTTGQHKLCLFGRTRDVAEMKTRAKPGGHGEHASLLVSRKWVEALEPLQDRRRPWDRRSG